MTNLPKSGSLVKLTHSFDSNSRKNTYITVGGFDPDECDLHGFHLCDENFQKEVGSIVFVVAITKGSNFSNEDSPGHDMSHRVYPKIIILDPVSHRLGWVWPSEIQMLCDL